jgi:hypothetical protein
MKPKGIFAAASAAAVVATLSFAAPVWAATIDLGFSLDESGSVGQTNFETTRDALADALFNAFSVNPNPGGDTYRIAVTKFDNDVDVVVGVTEVTASNIGNIRDTIKTAGYEGGSTATAEAITETFDLFVSSAAGLSPTSLINITTDGNPCCFFENTEDEARDAALAAHNAGLTGLSFEAVGSNIDLDLMRDLAGLGTSGDANLGVQATLGTIPDPRTTGFVLPVSDFDAYSSAIEAKVSAVIDPNPIPLPAAAWMLLAGIGALFGLRRRAA